MHLPLIVLGILVFVFLLYPTEERYDDDDDEC